MREGDNEYTNFATLPTKKSVAGFELNFSSVYGKSRSDGDNPESLLINHCGSVGVAIDRHPGTLHHDPPRWLLSNSELKSSPPEVMFNTLSLHLLKYGDTSVGLVTIRQIDDEGKIGLTAEEKSRTGILGRLLAGVWSKLAEVSSGKSTLLPY